MKTAFGLDVFTEGFPTEQKWKIYNHRSVRTLVYRSDLDHTRQLDVISEFIGHRIPEWSYNNISTEKSYGEIYKRFIDNVTLPDSYIEKMCNSGFCQYFWSNEEIDILKGRFRN